MQKLLSSLIQHDKIVTTQTKAKALKREVERLISRSKSLNLTVRRRVLATFSQKKVAEKFLNQVVPQFKERVGGYVRVVKLPPRRGDQAPLARVEFVEEIKGAVEKKAEPKAAAAKTPAKKPAAKSAARKPAKKAPAKRSAKKK
ncbi:MAG: 50S ribosomal protein L17 [candidate division CPR1 bacterium GW2011_GWC1_49_13]|uniref:50S ribosomal protein L17 n=1 Tax=candidate division CPR1 bacterium GW2011_GWC1_49_13 TaxID=1618342 RepID=A0A0G1YHX0_9BACT|nr:MAG: 50S ribosomal protein L17 [candidate division CPR1 bacterium GW2011_GWC1_49_13]